MKGLGDMTSGVKQCRRLSDLTMVGIVVFFVKAYVS